MKKLFFFMLVAFAVVGSCGCDYLRGRFGGGNADTSALLAKGDTAPAFALLAADGATVTSADLKGSYVLMMFFATWCPYCQLELPELQTMHKKYGSRPDFRVLAIGRQEHPDTLAAHFRSNNFTIPLYADTAAEVFHLFAKRSIPRVFLLDPQGVVLNSTVGYALIDSASGKTNFTKIANEIELIFGNK
jgi:peroxiredoxin